MKKAFNIGKAAVLEEFLGSVRKKDIYWYYEKVKNKFSLDIIHKAFIIFNDKRCDASKLVKRLPQGEEIVGS